VTDTLAPTPVPAPRDATPAAAWRLLHESACAPYRRSGRFAWHFARGKLGRDPVFRGMLERGDLPAACPRGRHRLRPGPAGEPAAGLHATHAQGRWPQPGRPHRIDAHYTGIELMPRDVGRAQAAWAGLAAGAAVHLWRHATGRCPHACGGHPRRAALRAATMPRRPRVLALCVRRRWGVPPTFGRPLAQWIALLEGIGFSVRSVPMSLGTTPGYLASVRQVRLGVATLHDRPGPLHVRAQRLAGDERQILYTFEVSDSGGIRLADGRATVVLNTPAILPGQAASASVGGTT
jgi:hypothetical protein